MIDPYEYFPGDGPWAELGCSLSAFAVVGGAGIWLLLRLSPKLKLLAMLFRFITLAALALLAFCASAIAQHNVGDWGRLKAQLRARHADVLACPSCPWPGRHTLHEDPLWQFRFTERHDPVRLYVRNPAKAEILVDFGHGGAAMFDLTTMVVTYSD
jgi:hypothetical protein